MFLGGGGYDGFLTYYCLLNTPCEINNASCVVRIYHQTLDLSIKYTHIMHAYVRLIMETQVK